MFESLKDHRWKHRIIAYTLSDKDIILFKQVSAKHALAIKERDLILISLSDESQKALAENLHANIGKTELFLIGKDGGLKERIDRLDLVYLFNLIDQMPMRQGEMRRAD